MSDNSKQIQVETQTYYLPEQSEPESNRYVFGYTITIRNTGTAPAKLTHRHWHITDANGKVDEVHGEGVIGEQPQVNPGDSFEYSSGVMLETPVGAMQGHYDMQSLTGEHFTASIAPFGLAVPGSVH
ncbi:MAG: Co2+/Mg2+ efflux protein ApaG [Pseudomonadota bacterium]|nr:Co2+/Mg2+ efflux protein ApaG [Pseudomonadota bacterium]